MQGQEAPTVKKDGKIIPRAGILFADRFMNRIEHNSEMIRNLEYKIDDLKDLIEKFIKDYPPPPPKE
jgi:hypothetical protein